MEFAADYWQLWLFVNVACWGLFITGFCKHFKNTRERAESTEEFITGMVSREMVPTWSAGLVVGITSVLLLLAAVANAVRVQ